MSRDRQIHEQVLVAVCRVLGAGIASVGIQVENGVVQVSGVVDTPDDRGAVERAVWSVPDVRAITQRVRVRRSYPDGPTDRTVANNVLVLFEREGHKGLRVQVEEGVVTIIGRFNSPAGRAAASAAVATVPGVRGVWMSEEPGAAVNIETPSAAPLVSRIRSIWS